MKFDILITLFFPINFHNLTSFNVYQSINIPCSTLSSLASSTRLFAYFTVRSTCPRIFMSPNLSRASFVRHSLCQCKIDDKQISFSEFSSNLHTHGVRFVQSYLNTLIHIKFRSSLYQCPSETVLFFSSFPGQIPSVSL